MPSPRHFAAAAIGYVHMKDLGGLRHPARDSINLGWRNAAFRGYADYMQTPEFDPSARSRHRTRGRNAADRADVRRSRPWRCHRSLVADALVVRGIRVLEIVSAAEPKEHALTPFAHVRGTRVTYPRDQSSLALEDKPSRSGQ